MQLLVCLDLGFEHTKEKQIWDAKINEAENKKRKRFTFTWDHVLQKGRELYPRFNQITVSAFKSTYFRIKQ